MSTILGDFKWDDDKRDMQNDEDEDEILDDSQEDDDDTYMDDENCTKTTLWMPSTFGRDFCFKNGWGKIVDQEIQLRIAQAEESLEELRLAIGHKSLLYKTCIRKSKTQSTKLRSHTQLDKINVKIKECASGYRCARSALLSLGASADILKKFQALQDKDLKVNTDVAEENRTGQQNDILPWFWRIESGESTDNPWMNESKTFTTPMPLF